MISSRSRFTRISPAPAREITGGNYVVETGPLYEDIQEFTIRTSTEEGLEATIKKAYPVKRTGLVQVGTVEGKVELFRQSQGTEEHPDGTGIDTTVQGHALLTGMIGPDTHLTAWMGQNEVAVQNLGDAMRVLERGRNHPSLLAIYDRTVYPTYADGATVTSIIAPLGAGYLRVRYKNSEAGWGVFQARRLRFSLLDDSDQYAGAWGWLSSSTNTMGDSQAGIGYSLDGTWATGIGGFVTPEMTARAVDQFVAIGTSLYYLRFLDIVPGSEQIEIGVLDPRTQLVRNRQILVRDEDYELDYQLGQLRLLRAVPFLVGEESLIQNSAAGRDRVVVYARYDHKVLVDQTEWNHREMIAQRIADQVELSAYYDETRSQDKLGRRLGTRIDAGRPEVGYTGLEWGHIADGAQVDYLSEDGGLSWITKNQNTDERGGANAYRGQFLLDRQWLRIASDGLLRDPHYFNNPGLTTSRVFNVQNEVGFYPAELTNAVKWASTYGKPYVVGRHLLMHNGGDIPFAQVEEGELGYAIGPVDMRTGLENRHGGEDDLSIVAGELGYRFLRYRIYGRHQQTVRDDRNISGIEDFISTIGWQADWTDAFKSDVRASLGAATWGGNLGLTYQNQQRQSISLMTNYAERLQDGRRTFGVGSMGEQPLGANSSLSASQRYETGDLQRGWLSGVGAKTSIWDSLTLSANFERGKMQSFSTDQQLTRTVASLGAGIGYDALSLSSTAEFRQDAVDRTGQFLRPTKQWISYNRAKYNWNEDVYSILFGQYTRSVSESNELLAETGEIGTGVGYRPKAWNFIDVLGMVRWVSQQDTAVQNPEGSTTKSLIASVDTYVQLPWRLFARHKQAYKKTVIAYDTADIDLVTMLQVVGAGWRYWGPLYAYGEYRFMRQWPTEVVEHGPTAELGVNPKEWIYVGIGYNFSRIEDRLYNIDPLDREGVYARLRLDF